MSVAEIKEELSRLTSAERVELMNVIWDSLDAKAQENESPAWHEEELRRRSEEVASGKAEFTKWEDAQSEVLRRTS